MLLSLFRNVVLILDPRYVATWTEPCMETDRDSCLNFEGESTIWCPDVGVEAPTVTDVIDVPTAAATGTVAAATNYSVHNK